MLVHAECIEFAWDSPSSTGYYPGQGPLPGGKYEIDSESQLATLTTIRGNWIFQFPGHQGRDPNYKKPTPARAVSRIEVAPTPQVEEVTVEAKKGKPMSEAVKKKIRETRQRKAAEKQARLEAA